MGIASSTNDERRFHRGYMRIDELYMEVS